MWQLVYIFLFSFSLLVTAAITKAAIRAAGVFSMLDHPGERKIQKMPMPVLGGVAIFLGFSFTVLINTLAVYELTPKNLPTTFVIPGTDSSTSRGNRNGIFGISS